MFFVSVYRLFKFAVQSFWRNIWLSLVTITIIVLLLFSATTLVGLNAMSDAVVATLSEKVDVSLYFNPEVSEDSVLVTREKILAFDKVASVEYVSAEQALAEFQKAHQNDPLVTEALLEVDSNPLGAVLQIKASEVAAYDQLIEQLKTIDVGTQIEDVDYQDRRLLITRLNTITDKTTLVVTILSSFFILIAILVVFNTIRLGIYAHREEVAIMKLVGATNWFTRLPFLAEGFLYALVSVIVFWFLFFILLNWLDPALSGFFGEINFSPKEYFSTEFISFAWKQLLGLTVINTISASIALRRYLNV